MIYKQMHELTVCVTSHDVFDISEAQTDQGDPNSWSLSESPLTGIRASVIIYSLLGRESFPPVQIFSTAQSKQPHNGYLPLAPGVKVTIAPADDSAQT